MLLWCSQQGIRRFLLTGLKQYIPFFCPATPHVLLRDGVFLSFPSAAFLCRVLSHSYYWMFNLGFGSSPPLVGLCQFCLIPKFHISSTCLSSYRLGRNACCQKGGGFWQSFLFKRTRTNEIRPENISKHVLGEEYVTDRLCLSQAAEFISKLMDSIKNNCPSTWKRNSQRRFGHYCDMRTNLKRKWFGLNGQLNVPELSKDSDSGNIWAPQFVTWIKSPNSIILESLSGGKISVNRSWDLCSHSVIQM